MKKRGKRKGHKVGQSWTTMRKIDGKKRKVKITKTSVKTYSVKRVGKN